MFVLFFLHFRKQIELIMGKLHIPSGGIMMTSMNISGLIFLEVTMGFVNVLWYCQLYLVFGFFFFGNIGLLLALSWACPSRRIPHFCWSLERGKGLVSALFTYSQHTIFFLFCHVRYFKVWMSGIYAWLCMSKFCLFFFHFFFLLTFFISMYGFFHTPHLSPRAFPRCADFSFSTLYSLLGHCLLLEWFFSPLWNSFVVILFPSKVDVFLLKNCIPNERVEAILFILSFGFITFLLLK